ncbi:unnamed protein product [Kluyveromyces dobzhanskii CBS 2104]|uniref:Signal peptidase complex subunit 2 n=1 Tax=Kluyveromyces dobzhanskii CBS 2104 TaxID=1427455 RepID=A0A0A8L5H0_9SACH|nr:unnamed protein product [Kluyveromyces dobzhanskii CBS 2104]
MSKPINVYSVPDARKTLDEAIPEIFSRLGYSQKFKLIDTKLVLGYSLIVFAAASFFIDKKIPWEQSKKYQQILVILYAIVCGVQLWFSKFVEKGTVYQGVKKSDKISVGAKYKKYSPEFQFIISNGKSRKVELDTTYTKFFSEEGYLQSEILFSWFKEQLQTLESKKLT